MPSASCPRSPVTKAGVWLSVALGALLPPLAPGWARAQEMPVPIEVQAALFSRIVQFDRNFEARSEDGLVVGILFQDEAPLSVRVKEEFSQALATVDLTDGEGRPPRVVEFQAGGELGPDYEAAGVDFLYVAPLRGVDLKTIVADTRRLGILTCSGVPEFAREGLAVGLDLQEGRPRILINLNGAKAEHADFRSGFLKLAQIIGEDHKP